ncbi:type II secretion system F family protein [Neorhodopirellula pilleata]|nr:type II secretion system F family protein [Neorhodopirellula pilleata]
MNRVSTSRFYTMLGDQLQVDVPLLEAIELIAKQEKDPSAKQLISEIAKKIETGESLSQSLASYPAMFSDVERNLIRSGEEGGFLADAVENISQMRDWQHQLTNHVCGAVAYPLLLISVASLLVPAVLIFLVPKLEPIFESLRRDEQLPWPTATLLKLSSLTQLYGTTVVGLLLIILVSGYLFIPRKRMIETRDRSILRVPLMGVLVREFLLARFCRVLGTLLQNKVQVIRSFEIASKVIGNQHLTRAISAVSDDIAAGRLLTDALERSHEMPSDCIAMLGVAERSNRLDSVLIRVSYQLEARTNRRLEMMVKMIEPVLLLVMAAFVGFVVLALLLPIFEGQTLG